MIEIPATFKNLRVEADFARIYSNTVTSPTMVWDKDQGWHDFTPRRRKSISDTALNKYILVVINLDPNNQEFGVLLLLVV